MARIKAEGHGAEWIDAPDDILPLFVDHPEFYSNGQICGEVIFVTSRSGDIFYCSFEVPRKGANQTRRVVKISSTYSADEIPTWVVWHGAPQFLFDNIFKEQLLCQAKINEGKIFILNPPPEP